MKNLFLSIAVFLTAFIVGADALAQELRLNDLIEEGLKSNHDILVSDARIEAAGYRIPQAKSLPDPMLTTGYQNDGFRRITYGSYDDSQVIFTASQMFPFPGKLGLKGEVAEKDMESQRAIREVLRLKTVSRIKELYYDLLLVYRNLDIIKDRGDLFSNIEEAATSRYASGKSSQQEILMAQTEKYLLLEKQEMFRQKIQSIEAMLAAILGRDASAPMGVPVEVPYEAFTPGIEEVIQLAEDHSPEIKSRQRMLEAAEAKLKIAKKDYYPDVTIAASVLPRGGEFDNMWSLTATFNVPLYFRTKQEPAVKEASASLNQARHELEAAKYMIAASIKDNYSMLRSSERLMELYKNGLIPKAHQDFELALSGYATGRTEAIVAITRLKNLLDYESQYWGQYAERQKAIARLHAISATQQR